jgi:hypothetical protein
MLIVIDNDSLASRFSAPVTWSRSPKNASLTHPERINHQQNLS